MASSTGKAPLVSVCAAVSSIAAAAVICTVALGSLGDLGIGAAQPQFAALAGSRRLLAWPALPGPDHTLPSPPSTSACKEPHTLAPTIFIIGFQHSGAQSLAKWMNMHDELSYGKVPMHKMYCYPTVDHVRDGRAYASSFQTRCGVKYTFDATPYAYQMAFGNSTHCHFRGAEGLEAFGKSIGPDHRFIFLLRDPVDRRNSYINHMFGSKHYEDDLIVADEEPCYADALDVWLQVFPRERFLFIKSEELYDHPQQVLNEVFEFAGVASRKYSQSELQYSPSKPIEHRPSVQVRQQHHSSHGRPECLQRLNRLTGLQFDWPGSSSAPLTQYQPRQDSSCKKLLKPTAYFIGFPYAGTTKLADMMREHPELDFGSNKEHYYWCKSSPRSLDEYHAGFLVPCTTKVAFDGCPILNEMAPRNRGRCAFNGVDGVRTFKAILGDADYRFVVLVRNPADWIHSHIPRAEELPLNDSLWDPCYANSLETFLEVFPRDRFLFLRSEDLFHDAQPVLSQVFEFLEVGPHVYPDTVMDRKVNHKGTSPISKEEASRFLNLPQMVECKARLERLTGMQFDWSAGH